MTFSTLTSTPIPPQPHPNASSTDPATVGGTQVDTHHSNGCSTLDFDIHTPGTYWLVVEGYGDADVFGQFQLTTQCSTVPSPAPTSLPTFPVTDKPTSLPTILPTEHPTSPPAPPPS